jgi:uncharacterized membrane protein
MRGVLVSYLILNLLLIRLAVIYIKNKRQKAAGRGKAVAENQNTEHYVKVTESVGGRVGAMYQTKIAELERALEEAKAQLAKEDGERFRVIWREIAQEKKERILGGLTDRQERVLFGLEVPEEPKRGTTSRPGGSGGDLTCQICGKTGLTRRGLALHTVRMHKEAEEAEAA